jgi:hypothetical protein
MEIKNEEIAEEFDGSGEDTREVVFGELAVALEVGTVESDEKGENERDEDVENAKNTREVGETIKEKKGDDENENDGEGVTFELLAKAILKTEKIELTL